MAAKMCTTNPYLSEFEEHFFTTRDGVRLRYLKKGQGMPLVMIPGFSSTVDVYSFNAPALSEHYAVYLLEMRGHGYSDAPDHGARIARLSADVREFVAALGVPKVDFVGHSMGCSVLWSYIDLFGQETINRMIFIDEPPALWANPADSDSQVDLYGGFRLDIWAVYNDYKEKAGGDVLLWKVLSSRGRREDNPQAMEALHAIPTPAKHTAFLADLMKDHLMIDWRDVFQRITVPVLLVSGDISHATLPETCVWMQSQMKDCIWRRYSAQEYGTHDMFINSSERFNREALAFFGGTLQP